MIPVERVTELLAEAMTRGNDVRQWPEDEAHHYRRMDSALSFDARQELMTLYRAKKAARVLADAGLIPTQREWGVEDEYSVIEFRGNEHAARTFAGGGADTIVSRWVGATDWEAPDE